MAKFNIARRVYLKNTPTRISVILHGCEDNEEIIEKLDYKWTSEKWEFRQYMQPVGHTWIEKTYEELESYVQYETPITGSLWDVERVISKNGTVLLIDMDWMLEAMIRDIHAKNIKGESKYIPALQSYYMIKAAIRDDIFDDRKEVNVFINGEETIVKQVDNKRYLLINPLFPDLVIEAKNMHHALQQVPYLLGLNQMALLEDIKMTV